jgi:hypothetical protein
MYAERWSDGGDFLISKEKGDPYSDSYLGTMTNNIWGNEFFLFDHGVEEKHYKKLPAGFIKQREQKLYIKYESNILGEQPRSLVVKLWDPERRGEVIFRNLPPKWNERAECYTLNFYG